MQNLAGVFPHELEGGGYGKLAPDLPPVQQRPKVTSSAKKRYEPSSEKGASLRPERSSDLMRNAGEPWPNVNDAPALSRSRYLKEGPIYLLQAPGRCGLSFPRKWGRNPGKVRAGAGDRRVSIGGVDWRAPSS